VRSVSNCVRRTAVALAAALGLALFWAPTLQADQSEGGLPRTLALSEARPRPVPTSDFDSFSLAAALHLVAERLGTLPNPYQSYDLPDSAQPRIDAPASTLSELERERRWFQMEDSADWMGVRLNQNVTAGFQVEFVGPAEDPRASRKIVSIRNDPFHQRYLLMTSGLTLRF